MATYVTGNDATNPNELLDKLKSFVEANGWVTNEYDDDPLPGISGGTPGKKLHIQHPTDNIFVNFRSLMGENIDPMRTNPTFAAYNGIAMNSSTSYDINTNATKPGFLKWAKQPGYPESKGAVPPPVRTLTDLNPDAIPEWCGIATSGDNIGAYHFFAFNTPNCIYALVEVVKDSGIWMHLAFGFLVKIGDWEGGTFFSASRSKYDLHAWTAKDPFNDPDKWERGTERPFKLAQRANLFIHGTCDGYEGWMCNIADGSLPNSGWVGRSCCGIVDTGDIQIPNYEYLLSRGKMTAIPFTPPVAAIPATPAVPGKPQVQPDPLATPTPKPHTDPVAEIPAIPAEPAYTGTPVMEIEFEGALCNEFNSTSVLLPLYAYGIRDPIVWKKYAVLGYAPYAYLCNVKYLAPGGTYELDHTGDMYTVFPLSKKGYQFGYDGIAIKNDVATAANHTP